MAVKAPLKPIGKRIAGAVRDYAAAQGLRPEDYVLTGSYDEGTERISLVFGTGKAIDERQWYVGISRAIRDRFPGDPQIFLFIGLIVARVADFDEIYNRFPPAEDEDDITDLLRP